MMCEAACCCDGSDFEITMVPVDKLSDVCKHFEKSGYRVLAAYDEVAGTAVNIEEHLHPDMVFFTNPHEQLVTGEYYIEYWHDKALTYYAP